MRALFERGPPEPLRTRPGATPACVCAGGRVLVRGVEPLELHDAFRGVGADLALRSVLSRSGRAVVKGEQYEQAGGQGQHGAHRRVDGGCDYCRCCAQSDCDIARRGAAGGGYHVSPDLSYRLTAAGARLPDRRRGLWVGLSGGTGAAHLTLAR